ncbi:hypothetical protein AAFF_G00334400 [Aldrovandia affinis]|uniref:Uncharacterized protein n=1 Tax=Aldrovandia affinis TaxID=143900 RepID=A0AAD7WPJ4_9TELE|nr:hypothetical protein AAFF_G00334400 [Aldrovandia affinis]
MGDDEWMSLLRKFAASGVWPPEASNRPATRQNRWYDLYWKPASGPSYSCTSIPATTMSMSPGPASTTPFASAESSAACIDFVNATVLPCHHRPW